MIATSTVTQKGQILLPKAIRDLFSIKPYDQVLILAGPEGIMVSRVKNVEEMKGIVPFKKRVTDEDMHKAIAKRMKEKYGHP